MSKQSRTGQDEHQASEMPHDDAYASYWLHESDFESVPHVREDDASTMAIGGAPSDDAYAKYWQDTAS